MFYTDNQGSRKMGTREFEILASQLKQLHEYVSTSQNELREMENTSQIGLKAQKRCKKTTVIEIISQFKNQKFMFFFYIPGNRACHGSHFWSVPSQFQIFWRPANSIHASVTSVCLRQFLKRLIEAHSGGRGCHAVQ